MQDFRYAFRAMRQSPLITSVAILSLAAGIGANTAIFTLLDQLLIRPMPVREPYQLIQLDLPGPRSGNIWTARAFSYPMYQKLRDGATTLDGLAAQFSTTASFSESERSEFVEAQLVSGNWFETIGLRTALGRAISREDDVTAGGHPVLVLTHGFWKRRFGGDAGVLGRSVLLNGQRMTVIGVAGEGFRGTDVGNPVDVFLPVAMQKLLMTAAAFPVESPRLQFLELFGRVKHGVKLDAVREDLNRVVAPILMDEAKVMPLRSAVVEKRYLEKRFTLYPAANGNLSGREQIQLAMWLLTALVGGVLLIACANVANLLLARATARRKEIAVRLALGASRWQLIRLVLAESLLLAVVGGAVGLLAAHWACDALLAFASDAASAPVLNSAPDGRILVFTVMLSLGTGLLFGLGPALAASRADVAPALKDTAGSVAGSSASAWMRKGLIVLQVSISMLLLAAASLFLSTLDNLRKVNPGFDTENVIAFRVNPPLNGYDLTRTNEFYRRLSEELALMPRVSSTAFAAEPLLTESLSQSTVRVEGYQQGEDEDMNPATNEVGPGFFQTMRIPLLEGRDFTEADGAGAPPVAIVSATFARKYFKDGSALGRKIGFGRTNRAPYIMIVGVVQDTRHLDLRKDEHKRQVYTPSAQAEHPTGRTFYLRTAATLDETAPAIRAAVRNLDGTLPITGMRTMRQQIEISLMLERLVSTLCAAFGFLATLMAAVGLYGVMAFHVSRRTREIGVRMAMGARSADVLRLVLREASMLAAAGVAIGVPLALVLSRFARSILFGIEPNNAWVYLGSAAMLIGVAMLASYLPARRASKVDPISALRYE